LESDYKALWSLGPILPWWI